MNKKLNKAHEKFYYHFHYSPEFPPNVDFDQDTYADELLRCVDENFDYTIEKYGTKVPDFSKFGSTEIFID